MKPSKIEFTIGETFHKQRVTLTIEKVYNQDREEVSITKHQADQRDDTQRIFGLDKQLILTDYFEYQKAKTAAIAEAKKNGEFERQNDIREILVWQCNAEVVGVFRIKDGIYDLPEGLETESDIEWNDLMPAVEKVNMMEPSEFNYHVDRMTQFRVEQGKIQMLSISSPMRIVYSAVVDFIKWYNQPPKPNEP